MPLSPLTKAPMNQAPAMTNVAKSMMPPWKIVDSLQGRKGKKKAAVLSHGLFS
jgi:hypothetical protein